MRPLAGSNGSPRLGRLLVLGLVVVPLVVGGLLAWALAAPTANLDRVVAAIVNDDVPVTVDGQTLPLGRELAAGLMAGEEPVAAGEEPATPSFDWVLTNGDEADTGLASGRYVAVVTIPASFSADATSISGPGAQARQAAIGVRTTPASAWLDPALTGAVTDAAASAFGRQLTTRYLAQVYAGFNQIADEIGQAADGADQLAGGASAAAGGASELAAGSTALADGLAALDAGAASVASGLADLDAAAAPLPTQTAELARAANEVARALGAAIRRADAATAAFAAVVAEVCIVDGPVCERARAALRTLVSADENLRTLVDGARRVAAGNDLVAVAMPRIVGGIDAAAAGAGEVATGAASSSAGGADLASGAAEVASGTASVSTGAAGLASGLGTATEQLPTYSDDDVSTLSTVVAQPVVSRLDAPASGLQSIPLFTMIALWIGALVATLALPPVPTRWLLTGMTSMRVALRAIAPLAALGAVQGLVVTVAVLATAAASPLAWVSFAGAAALVGTASTLVVAGLAAAFGGVGRLIAVMIGVVALAAGLSSTVPPVVGAVADAVPTAAAIALLRGALSSDSAGVVVAIAGLVAAGIVGAGLVYSGVLVRRRVLIEST